MTQAFALYLHSPTNPGTWVSAFHELAPELEVRVWPEPPPQAEAVYALTWSPPEGFFAAIPNLKGVFALAAGVDRLVNRADLAPDIPLVRLTDAGMARQMVEYVLYGVLRFQRDFDAYAEDQAAGTWRPRRPRSAAETRVLVLGLGELGGQVAQALAGFGYAVSGWSRSPREIEGVDCLHGLEALDAHLERVDVLASVLPSTPGTRGLLDRARLSRLPAGAAVINVGRGDLIELDALCDLLDSGHLRGAWLDVLPQEPAPADSRAWRCKGLQFTPHVAASTLPYPSAQQILEKLEDLRVGRAMRGLVAR